MPCISPAAAANLPECPLDASSIRNHIHRFYSPIRLRTFTMHSVDLLEEAQQVAEQAGFEIRRQWLGESLGGACRLGNRWVLFINLSLTADEQLQQVIQALNSSPQVAAAAFNFENYSPQLKRLLLH